MSLRSLLREAGAPWHARVDAAYSGYRLDRRAGYCKFLLAHAHALWQLEPALEAAGIALLLPDWSDRCRRHALQQDLLALGVQRPQLVTTLQLPGNPSLLWGLAYVLEGSRLGSRVLAGRVEEGGWPGHQHALNYLRHGQDAALWPRFLTRLEEQADAVDRQALLDGARQGFAIFHEAALSSVTKTVAYQPA